MIISPDTKLIPPNGEMRLLLHCCCAPCSGGIIELLWESNIDLTLLFYNPNIHPKEEYNKRKAEIVRFARAKEIPFTDGDYDPDPWFLRVEGLEDEPERGKRCSACFDLRLERSALFAVEHEFKMFSSTFGISRWKDMDQVNASGLQAASRYPNLTYWTYNWRFEGGTERMQKITKRESFYKQSYCGCVYSQRNTNTHLQTHSESPDLTLRT